jgi:single-stranded-DNA-specific exonuclease
MAVSARERIAAMAPQVRPEESWQGAEQALHAFLAQVPAEAQHVLLCHNDADGLAAGAIFFRSLERSGRHDLQLLPMGKGESAWSMSTIERVAAARPAAIFVLDLGSRAKPIFPGLPTLVIDHHRPLGVPPAGTLISSYQWQPSPCTAALVYWLGAALADLEDLAWVAAVGIVGDLGEHATLEPLPQARARYGTRMLREATTLVNAARRSPSGDASPALNALLAAQEPADIARGRLPEARQLAQLREDFNAALAEAKRAAPSFADRVALIRVHSPYQVHPILAQIWRGRLPNHIVMVANEGYLPGRVSFSLRTCLDVNLLSFLQAFRQSIDATEFGHGHDRATGGILLQDDYKRLLATMGFHVNNSRPRRA